MGLLSLLATAVFLDDITKDPAEIERQKRIRAARERDEDKLRRKIKILKEEFGEDAINKIKL